VSRGASLAILLVLASLLVPGIASAHSATGAENRVWAFDLAEQVHVAGQHALTLELHQGYDLVEYDSASGSLLAARGGLPIKGFRGSKGANPFHALDRAIERGVSPKAILEAVKNPSVVVEQAGGRTLYLTKDAAVVLDSAGQALTVWGGAQHTGKTLDLLRAAGAIK